MNTLFQKLQYSATTKDFADANNEIQQAINVSPAEMLKELETEYLKASEAAETALKIYGSTVATLEEDLTVENKAAAWDAFWEKSNAQEYASAIYGHLCEAGFQVEHPEEVERLRNERVITTDEFPF